MTVEEAVQTKAKAMCEKAMITFASSINDAYEKLRADTHCGQHGGPAYPLVDGRQYYERQGHLQRLGERALPAMMLGRSTLQPGQTANDLFTEALVRYLTNDLLLNAEQRLHSITEG